MKLSYRLALTLLLPWVVASEWRPEQCPAPFDKLLSDYKDFHAKMRTSPDAKYLVWYCGDGGCCGAGDRIRGTLWMLRVAMAFNRVLLLHWLQPADLTNFFLPGEIDWSLNGINMNVIDQPNTIDMMAFYDSVYRGNETQQLIWNATKTLRHTTNEHFMIDMVNHPPVTRAMETASCLFNYIFRPHPTVEALGQHHIRSIYGTYPVDFVAWHWRHGDADTHQESPVKLTTLEKSISCGVELGATVGINASQTPILLVTDFNAARKMAQGGHFRYLASPNITATHLDDRNVMVGVPGQDQQTNAAMRVYTDIFVDLYIMSRARCLVMSVSGFSNAALWWGGEKLLSCHRDMHQCRHEATKRQRRR